MIRIGFTLTTTATSPVWGLTAIAVAAPPAGIGKVPSEAPAGLKRPTRPVLSLRMSTT